MSVVAVHKNTKIALGAFLLERSERSVYAAAKIKVLFVPYHLYIIVLFGIAADDIICIVCAAVINAHNSQL